MLLLPVPGLSIICKDEYSGGGVVDLFVASELQDPRSSLGWRQLEDGIEFGE